MVDMCSIKLVCSLAYTMCIAHKCYVKYVRVHVHCIIVSNFLHRFPLYLKSVERALFHYAVHLLNKNIAQVHTLTCTYRVTYLHSP